MKTFKVKFALQRTSYPDAVVQKLGELAKADAIRQVNAWLCEQNGHLMEPCPDDPAIPWTAICTRCRLVEDKVEFGFPSHLEDHTAGMLA